MSDFIPEERGDVKRLAGLLHLGKRHVNELVADGTLHKEKQGDFVLWKAICEYYKYRFLGKEEVDYAKEKAKHEYIKRQLSELELARRRHEVHAAADVELVMVDMLTNLRTQLLGIADKMAPQLEGKPREEIANMLTYEMETRLSELSDYNPTMFDIEPEADNETEND